MNFKDSIKVIKALSEENRLRIVLMLKERKLCVCEINDMLDIALSTISAHLKQLREAGIIEDEKDGRWINYTLTSAPEVLQLIHTLTNTITVETAANDLKKLSTLDRSACSK